MPKLDQKQQQQVASAPESGTYGPMPEGIYTVQLKNVAVTSPNGGGDPYWATEWVVQAAVDGDTAYKGRRLFENISTGEKSAWKMRQFFDAMGYTYDSDTDEMIGEVCQAVVVQRPIEQGKRQGQVGNEIDRWLPIPEDGWQTDAGTGF